MTRYVIHVYIYRVILLFYRSGRCRSTPTKTKKYTCSSHGVNVGGGCGVSLTRPSARAKWDWYVWALSNLFTLWYNFNIRKSICKSDIIIHFQIYTFIEYNNSKFISFKSKWIVPFKTNLATTTVPIFQMTPMINKQIDKFLVAMDDKCETKEKFNIYE